MSTDGSNTRRDPRTRAAAFQQRGGRARDEGPDQGTIFARSPRTDGSEFRVSLHKFRGNTFARAAVWQQNPSTGQWWPARNSSGVQGVTIRLTELSTAVAGLCDLMDAVDGTHPGSVGPSSVVNDAAHGDGAAHTPNDDDMEGF